MIKYLPLLLVLLNTTYADEKPDVPAVQTIVKVPTPSVNIEVPSGKWYIVETKVKYLVLASSEGKTEIKDYQQAMSVTVASPVPVPIPTPPDIVPDPPTPVPNPDAVPTGIRVLLLYNENATREQLNVVNSIKVYQWMVANCTKTDNGGLGWRRWDITSVRQTGVANESEVWQKLWKVVDPATTQDNMIYITVGNKVYHKPITTVKDALTFLQQTKDGK